MRVYIENNELVIQPQGFEQLWSLCRGLRVPKAAIAQAEWHETLELGFFEAGLRVGTALPWVLVAGWFYGPSKRKAYMFLPGATYLFMLKAHRVLSLQLNGYRTCNWIYVGDLDESLVAQITTWSHKP